MSEGKREKWKQCSHHMQRIQRPTFVAKRWQCWPIPSKALRSFFLLYCAACFCICTHSPQRICYCLHFCWYTCLPKVCFKLWTIDAFVTCGFQAINMPWDSCLLPYWINHTRLTLSPGNILGKVTIIWALRGCLPSSKQLSNIKWIN